MDFIKTKLAELEGMHDKTVCMQKSNFSSPGYHTTLMHKNAKEVHRTRESLSAATAFLVFGGERYTKIANDMIKKVISLQDTNKENKTCGIWQWFLEEPLSEMNPPDWNWADFCGGEILYMLLECQQLLYSDTKEIMLKSLDLAISSIVRRDVTPGYTNIAVLGSYVSIVGGRLFEKDDYVTFGENKLKSIYKIVKNIGAFSEYNSPTYTFTAIHDLKRMLLHFPDGEMKDIAKELYMLSWETIASHFHSKNNHIAGPHLRSYSSIFRDDTPSILNYATDGIVKIPEFLSYKPHLGTIIYDVKCPVELLHYFKSTEERVLKQLFAKDEEKDIYQTAYTYISPEYSLGSVDICDFWNQRRALLGYFGDLEKPVYITARMLHDDFDFSTAVLRTVQDKNKLIGLVNCAYNGGDTHINIDRIKDGEISLKRLEFVFEIGGDVKSVSVDEGCENSFVIGIGGQIVNLNFNYAEFKSIRLNARIENKDEKIYIIIEFYNGQETTLNLKETEIACGFSIGINEDFPICEAISEGNSLTIKSEAGELTCLKKGALVQTLAN